MTNVEEATRIVKDEDANRVANAKRCPRCQALNPLDELPQRAYRCAECGLELVYLDVTIHGTIRGVIGWLLDAGATVGDRYRVRSVLGRGGFGVTYLVEDLRLHGKRRALKEVPESLFDEHETQLLGRLSHPAIPDITDRFSDSGMVYLVLEFGGDRTLRTEQKRRGGRIPLFALLPWMRQLCDVLQYLHAQNPPVIHRDLKPDNVLLDEQDRIMLIDFGIAKESIPDSVTRTLGRAASQGFSPPEQVLGTGTDPRSDVYALGAILYTLLSGQVPAAAHVRIAGAALAPLSNLLPDLPPLIDEAVLKALELNVNLRQQSIAELADVLRQAQENRCDSATILAADGPRPETTGQPVTPGPTGKVDSSSVHLPSVQLGPPPSVRRAWIGPALAGLLGLGILGGGGFWFWQRQAETETPGMVGTTAAGATAPAGSDRQVLPDAGMRPAPGRHSDAGKAPLVALPADTSPPSVPDAASGAPPTSSPGPDPTVAETPPPAPPVAPGTGTLPTPAPAAAGSSPDGMAAASPNLQGGTPPPSIPDAGELPSIFSSEQRPAPAPAAAAPGESLLDLFEQRRQTHSTTEDTILDAATVAPGIGMPAPPAATTSAPPPAKPASARTSQESKPPPRPAKKPETSTASGGGSDWGFQYKGAKKTE